MQLLVFPAGGGHGMLVGQKCGREGIKISNLCRASSGISRESFPASCHPLADIGPAILELDAGPLSAAYKGGEKN